MKTVFLIQLVVLVFVLLKKITTGEPMILVVEGKVVFVLLLNTISHDHCFRLNGTKLFPNLVFQNFSGKTQKYIL